MKNKLKICLSIMVISVIFIGMGSASQSDTNQDEPVDYYLPDYGAKTFESLKGDSNVIAIRGSMPEITELNEKREWLETLNTCVYNSQSELHPYMKEFGGPLAGFGYSYEGYLFIDIDAGSKETVDENTIEKLYEILNEDAKSLGVNEVPVVFEWQHIVAVEDDTSSLSDEEAGENKTTKQGPGFTSIMLILGLLLVAKTKR